jgi:hypothetical protein
LFELKGDSEKIYIERDVLSDSNVVEVHIIEKVYVPLQASIFRTISVVKDPKRCSEQKQTTK